MQNPYEQTNPYTSTGNNPATYNLSANTDNPYGNNPTYSTYPAQAGNINYEGGQAGYVSSPPVYNMEVEQQMSKSPDPLKHLDDGLLGQARKKFIMKVYLILSSMHYSYE